MKIIQKQPADNWREAFPFGNEEMLCRVYGHTKEERIDLYDTKYLKERDGKISRGKTTIGQIKIAFGEENDVTNYQRGLDLDMGIGETTWGDPKGQTKITTFVPKDYKIMVCEITRPENDLNLRISYIPQSKQDYINGNTGGLFFTSSLKKRILCGKAAVATNGIPAVDEAGVQIKNASKVTIFIMLDTAEFKRKAESQQAMLNLQMQMNRSLVSLESKSLQELAKGPKGNMKMYRRMKKKQE